MGIFQSKQGAAVAVEDNNVAEPKTNDSAPYEAPYDQYEDNVPGSYIVSFREGHTLEKHFAFLAVTFEASELHSGYYTHNMSDELFRKVRTDPGVKNISDNFLGEGL